MLKETLGAAVLGMTLVGAPGTAMAANGGGTSAAPPVKKEYLTVRIDTDRRGWRGVVRIRVQEADDRSPARGVPACLEARRWGEWRSVGCERTDRWGRADWTVRVHRHHSYRIRIPETWRYHAYYSDRFRIERDRNWRNDGHDLNDDHGRGWGRGDERSRD